MVRGGGGLVRHWRIRVFGGGERYVYTPYHCTWAEWYTDEGLRVDAVRDSNQ